MKSIAETVGIALGLLAVLGMLIAGYAAWRERRRVEDEPDKSAKRAGGPGEED